MKLTKTSKAQIIAKIEKWLKLNQDGKGFGIYVEDFEEMVDEIQKSLGFTLDTIHYFMVRDFCKGYVERHNYGIDLSKAFTE